MKRLFLAIIVVIGFLAFSELDISLKESGYIARYVRPFYASRIEPQITPLVSNIDWPFINDEMDLPAFASEGEIARVRRVIDGDTIDVLLNGQEQRIRYVGINTPERDEPCFGEATRANSNLVRGKTVRLVRDQTDVDRYGRLLRYVYVGDTLVERELVAQGFAESVLYRSDDRHFREFSNLESDAARAGLGCHPTGIFNDGDSRR